MPRSARVRSKLNVYHVMLRGVNSQQIFHDEEDFRYFTKLLDRFKKPCGYELLAYCLMGNHVHLLLKEGPEASLGDIFRHIGTAFVYWYNLKYDRNGHLFQDRFKSEPVEDDAYLLTAFRYILMNPVRAGICRMAENYPYSSAGEYLKAEKGITDTKLIGSMLDEEAMREFVYRENSDRCLEMADSVRKRVTDERATELIRRELGSGTPTVGKANERQTLYTAIRKLTDEGISIRQLSRLTGLSKKIIETALK